MWKFSTATVFYWLHFGTWSFPRQLLCTRTARGKSENLFKPGSWRNDLLTWQPVQDCAHVSWLDIYKGHCAPYHNFFCDQISSSVNNLKSFWVNRSRGLILSTCPIAGWLSATVADWNVVTCQKCRGGGTSGWISFLSDMDDFDGFAVLAHLGSNPP